MLFLLQNFLNIDGTRLFLIFCPHHFVQGLRSKNIEKAITFLLLKLGKI